MLPRSMSTNKHTALKRTALKHTRTETGTGNTSAVRISKRFLRSTT